MSVARVLTCSALFRGSGSAWSRIPWLSTLHQQCVTCTWKWWMAQTLEDFQEQFPTWKEASLRLWLWYTLYRRSELYQDWDWQIVKSRAVFARHLITPCPTLKPDNLEEGKAAHKRAEQIRRNEHSTLIVELKHCLPPEFLDGCQSTNQRPGYTKNGILKAMLMYHKHQAAVIEKQRKIIEAEAAKNAASEEESNARLIQRVQQCVAYEESRCWSRTRKAYQYVCYYQLLCLHF